MALAQTTETVSIGSPTPRLKTTASLLTPNRFTFMCWATHTGTGNDAYQDLFGISDTNDVIGITLHRPAANRFLSIGDLNTDNDGSTVLIDGKWYHFCLTVDDVAGTGTRCFAYLDGRLAVGPVSLVNPVTPTFQAVWNSRASDSDAGAVLVGKMEAVKIWNNVALTMAEVQNEIPYYRPQVKPGHVWGWFPLIDVDTRTRTYGGFGGLDWTTQSSLFSTGVGPGGLSWDNPLKQRTWVFPASVASGAIAGVSSLAFAAGSSTLTGAGTLAGASALLFAAGSSTLTGAGALAGSSALVFGAGSSFLSGIAPITGTAALVFAEGSSTVTGSGALAGASAVVFGAGSSTLTGAGVLAGTAAAVFGAGSSTLTGSGVLAGDSALVFGHGSSTLAGAGALAGSADLTFSLEALPTLPSGSILGTAALSFGDGSSTLTGAGTLTGTAALATTATAALQGAGALAGLSALIFTGTAPLTGVGALAGSTALTLAGSATLRNAAASGSLLLLRRRYIHL